MANIATVFRPKLDAGWPNILPQMLTAACDDREHDPELEIGMAIGSWLREDSLDPKIKEILVPDAIAFSLSCDRRKDGSKAKYFSYGDRTAFTPELIALWRDRAKQVDHHIAKARFSDASWELAPNANCKRDIGDALSAIDNYIGQCTNARSAIHCERCLRRAHFLAKSLSDGPRDDNVRTSIMALCAGTQNGLRDTFVCMAFDLYVATRDAKLSTDDKMRIIHWLEESLNRHVTAGDAFTAERFASRLIAHYRGGDAAEHRRVAMALGAAFEHLAQLGSGMLALRHLTHAHKIYQDASLNNEVKRIRPLIDVADGQSKDEMSAISATFEITLEEMKSFVDSIVRDDCNSSIRRFLAAFLHRQPHFERQLDQWMQRSVLMNFMSVTIMTDSGERFELQPPTEDRESHLALKSAEVFNLNAIFMEQVLEALWSRFDITPETLVEMTDTSPLFSANRHGLCQRAFTAYCLGDYATFIHMAVPQIEQAIRLMYSLQTSRSAASTRDSNTWLSKTLNTILEDDEFIEAMSDKDILPYLSYVLVNPLSWNVRNLVCHGLVGDDWFHRRKADRLLHVMILLARLFVKRTPGSGDNEDTGQEPVDPSQ